ncbi:MAG TPA: radical SAM protein [Candidatus Lokiarchaeia archaeon]|nr:radical SAM protein [Candidatus Lokiarchaeia archaeon]
MSLELIDQIGHNPAYIWELDEDSIEALKLDSFNQRVNRFGSTLFCHVPGFPFVSYEVESFTGTAKGVFESISLTGMTCALQCDHCRGQLLNTMRQASVETFEQVLNDAIASGARGVLVSGGSDTAGKVPILDVLETLKRAKNEQGIEIVIHSGYMEDDEIAALKDANIDGIMFDFIGSEETAKSVCHIDATPVDYTRMVATCKKLCIPVMPHVVIGLDWGAIKGEVEALSMLGELLPDVLVLVILMPFPGTPMENIIPDLSQVEKVILLARLLNPTIPVQLGCAKPHGEFKEHVERFAVECGVNGMAFPLQETLDHARKLGLKIKFVENCCSLVYKEIS